MLVSNDNHLDQYLRVAITHTVILFSDVGQVKSFVDDLNKELGTVSMRVVFVI